MVCMYGVAIEPGNYADDCKFISTAPCPAALEEKQKPQKNCHLSDKQMLTSAPRVTPHPLPGLRLTSEGHNQNNSPAPDKSLHKQIKNRQPHIVLRGG